MTIYLAAHARMTRHLRIENNRLIWDFTNPEELKISENIYEYLTTLWEYDNKQLESGKYHLKTEYEGYSIITIENDESSRAMEYFPLTILANSFDYNWNICRYTYENYQRFRYTSEFIDFDTPLLEPDGTGCDVKVEFQDKGKGYRSYCIIDACPLYHDYKCILNRINNPYSHLIEGKDGSSEYLRTVRNNLNSHLITIVEVKR